jgi:hypothetical protein
MSLKSLSEKYHVDVSLVEFIIKEIKEASTKNTLNEVSFPISDRIEFLESLLDANEKFHAITEGDGKNYVQRAQRFQKKWNRFPLKLKEVEEIKKELDSLKRKKYSLLKK